MGDLQAGAIRLSGLGARSGQKAADAISPLSGGGMLAWGQNELESTTGAFIATLARRKR
ncbi:hypothetical protein GCM10027203_76580 [Nonomuraea fastidiosa]